MIFYDIFSSMAVPVLIYGVSQKSYTTPLKTHNKLLLTLFKRQKPKLMLPRLRWTEHLLKWTNGSEVRTQKQYLWIFLCQLQLNSHDLQHCCIFVYFQKFLKVTLTEKWSRLEAYGIWKYKIRKYGSCAEKTTLVFYKRVKLLFFSVYLSTFQETIFQRYLK